MEEVKLCASRLYVRGASTIRFCSVNPFHKEIGRDLEGIYFTSIMVWNYFPWIPPFPLSGLNKQGLSESVFQGSQNSRETACCRFVKADKYYLVLYNIDRKSSFLGKPVGSGIHLENEKVEPLST